MKILLDTCVIVDALQSRVPFSQDAQVIFLDVAIQKYIGCISAKSVTDIYYLMRRFFHGDKETRAVLKKLFSLFTVVDTFGVDCISAVDSEMGDYEDAVMSETAARSDVDYIVTRNEKDYSKSKVAVISPADFLKRIGKR